MEELLERMSAAAAALERVAQQMEERHVALAAEAEQSVERIVATVESQREAELAERLRVAEEKLAQAEGRIAELSAAAASAAAPAASVSNGAGRKTISPGMVTMLAKQGVSVGSLEVENGRFEAGALDSALASLSIEQRFAVKAELLRAGVIG